MSIKWNRCNRCQEALKEKQTRFCDKCRRIISNRKRSHKRIIKNRWD